MPWYAWAAVGFLLGIWTFVLIAFFVIVLQAWADDEIEHVFDDER